MAPSFEVWGHVTQRVSFPGLSCSDPVSIPIRCRFATDGFHRAAFHSLDGPGYFFGSLGLVVDYRVSDVVIPTVDVRCCHPA